MTHLDVKISNLAVRHTWNAFCFIYLNDNLINGFTKKTKNYPSYSKVWSCYNMTHLDVKISNLAVRHTWNAFCFIYLNDNLINGFTIKRKVIMITESY